MERIRCKALQNKIMSADEAAALISPGSTIGVSGFTAVGYPKAVPMALAKRAEAGEDLHLTVIAGGNAGDQADGSLARSGAMARRYGFQGNKDLRRLINEGKVQYCDVHLSHVPYLIRNGYYGKIDVAILEVAGVREDGSLVSSCAAGILDVLAEYAEHIILEVNDRIPREIEGFHDFFLLKRAPNTQIIPITSAGDRIGSPYVSCDPSKVLAVVNTSLEDTNANLKEPDKDMRKIASYIIRFLKDEQKAGRLPDPLPPLQSGVGGVANAVLEGIAASDLENLSVYTEVMQDAVLSLIDSGKVKHASGTALTISPDRRQEVFKGLERYRGKIVIRSQEIANSPEVIRRLSCIAMNTAIEVDLAGNVNSSHVNGTDIMNGVGGSGDYTRNSGLSIFTTLSTAKNGTLSCIVPHVGHVDQTEHDTEIIVTEQGLADLRGLTAYERAEALIENCAHPKFREELRDYVARAKRSGGGLHAIKVL